ncbi:TetR/AcrR family transcriptional regulator [Rhodococcus rhodochrous]|uniref:TetR/AcrR family transcriptional regulator n=1 Tax=Rhodococcus rhodochrous TaxID=1829 RepID=UPI00031D80CD|nr:TetR/AcrR family transcriptional regulator [Rhodococcus rhodochrous]
MVEQSPREKRYEERRRAILDAARHRADDEGWGAVTTRHLAEAIGYSQPVLYGHFPGGKAEIVLTVAMEGFVELTRRCRAALDDAEARGRVESVADAYLDFACSHPAVYEAMFQQAIDAEFAGADTPADMRAGFEVLAETIGDDARGCTTETFWAALHGMHLLERAGRMRPESRADRVAELSARYANR